MNSSNNPLDKRLQQRFQQLFASEHAVVDDALKQRIWDQLPPTAPPAYRSVGFLLLGVFLLVSIGLYYRSTRMTTTPKRAYSAGRHSVGRHPASRAQIIRVKPSNQRSSVVESMGAHPLDATAHLDLKSDRLSAGSPDGPLNTPAMKTILTPATVNRRHAHKRTHSQPEESHLISLMRGPSTNQVANGLATNRKRHRTLNWSAIGSNELVRLPVMANPSNDSSTNESVTNWASFSPIHPLHDGSAGGMLSAPLRRRVDFLPVVASSETASSRPAKAIEWFFTAAPFSTYQRMTIIAKTDTYVRDVTSPAPWSSQTWGYQLSGGVRWWGWDAAVSYGQLRRWAYYERATDDYQVEPSGPTAYQVTRRTEAVAENVSLSLLGLSLNRQYEWGQHRRYYAQAGAQFSYVLPTRQPLGWLQAGWGLTLPLGKWHQFQFGPMVAYSLNDLWNTDSQLRIHPYTAGFSLTIRPQPVSTRLSH